MIFIRSIRWRIQAWHALLLTLVVVGFGVTAHRLASTNRLRAVDQELQALEAKLGIALPPSSVSEKAHRQPPRPGVSITDQITASGAHFIVWNGDGTVQASSANLPQGLQRPEHDGAGEANYMRTVGGMRQAVRFMGTGRCFLVGRPIAQELGELRQLAWYLAAAGAGVLALGLLGGWWMATRAMRPVANISTTAEKIATGDLSQRIPMATSDDELGKLASVLNSTFSRLDAAFTQQARFTADAAHELRTPVTAILMHAQEGLATAPLTEEQRESFDACQRAARRMTKLVDALLELARLDAGQESIKREPCDLADVANDCLDLVQSLAEARNITLEIHLDPAPCLGDSQRLGQVVTNLLTNAIKHTHDHIIVATRREEGHVTLAVTDNGPGIGTDHLTHLFERFYRADTSRNRATGGTGLGLAICKAIVEAHAGTIAVQSKNGAGSTFVVTLPQGGL